MDDQLENIINVLGTIGAYFAIVLVLSIAVETILDSIKQNRWLARTVQINEWLQFLDVQKKRVSPDQAMRDIAYWVPENAQAEVQMAALNNMAREFGVALGAVTQGADAAFSMANDLVAMTGISRQSAYSRQQLAQKLYVIRQKFNAEEGVRVMRLRRVAAGIGVILALLFRLDTFQFLAPLFSPAVQGWLELTYVSVGGMLLTGVASSAGSSFWHDQLDRVRAVKKSARMLSTLQANGA